MPQDEILFRHEQNINVIEALRVLKADWEREVYTPPISEEAVGNTEDVFVEIKQQYVELGNAFSRLLQSTIESLEKTDETTVEMDKSLGDSMRGLE